LNSCEREGSGKNLSLFEFLQCRLKFPFKDERDQAKEISVFGSQEKIEINLEYIFLFDLILFSFLNLGPTP
jgi:hypothetical protein